MKEEEIVVTDYIHQFTESLISYIPNILKAIVILIIGLLIIKLVRRVITTIVTKKPEHDPTLLKFLLDVVTWTLRAFIFVAVIDKLGVNTATFAAAIAAAGLAVGLSLQGSLSNFAGGLLIILFKPFRIGDYIEAQGQAGTVNSIQIFSTRLTTANNQVVYLPNGTLSNNTIKNFSQEPLRRAEIVLRVGYDSNLKHVKEIINNTLALDSRILNQPAPVIEIRNLGENAVEVGVYMWTERPNYSGMVSGFYENIKSGFENASIEIPQPKTDIHITNNQK